MNASPTMPPTPLETCDQMLAELDAAKGRWAAMPPAERALLLRDCMPHVLEHADRWAATACRVKGYDEGTGPHGEEFLAGTVPVMRNLRLYAEALEAGGEPRLPSVSRRPDGQWVARVFPQNALDKAMFAGVSCDIWIEPGKDPTQGQIYRSKREGKGGTGAVCVVLGAGNQSSIGPMDVLYKLVVDDEVCIMKMNPVNEALGPVIEDALRPLVDAGFLRICYGGAEVGKHLTDHKLVHSIHITGSAAVHDAIVWGPGKAGEKAKKKGKPRLNKPITSELGAVSPLIIVPGDWSEAELHYHARQAASMLAYNCGFNCNGVRLIICASGWPQRDRFEALVREKLAATPTRHAYYPTAKATWDAFTARYEHSELGELTSDSALPWTLLEGVKPESEEFALTNEPWCGITSFVTLDARNALDFLAKVVPFCNDQCWGTLSCNVFIHPSTEDQVGAAFDEAIAGLQYGGIAINCWSGLNYGLVNATWGAFPGHPLDDIESGQGVVHNALLLDHPQKSVVRAPFMMKPTPAWFTDHKNNIGLGRIMTSFESNPGWIRLPSVVFHALRG